MAKPSDTRERILAAARGLFIERGVQQTSLRDIAEQLGLSKPALYHHFDSREALLESIVEPLIEDINAFVARHESERPVDPRSLLSSYFDLLQAHRETLTLLVRDLSTLGALNLGARLLEQRRRLIALLGGSESSVADRVRATVAIGGLSDCVVELPDVAPERIKDTAVDAACGALGIGSTVPPLPGRARRARTR
jgi:AcrR family transcriptional regulator